MSTLNGPAIHAPTSVKGGQTSSLSKQEKNAAVKQQFISAVLMMSWQLAVVVLLPVIGGVELDKVLGSSNVCLFIGLGVAAAGSGLVLWHTVQVANRIPVPRLTDAQKKEIQKAYEDEDND